MIKALEEFDEVGVWSIDKLNLLEKYAQAYSSIMHECQLKYKWKYHYVDPFFGSLTPKDKRTGEYIAGSPLRALSVEKPFNSYTFIEINPERAKRARKLKEEYPDVEIEVYEGDCNVILLDTAIPKLRKKGNKCLIFIDPYGLSVQWKTMEALAAARNFDVFINFPIMSLTRNLPNSKLPSDKNIELIDTVLGRTDWQKELYPPCQEQLNLFGNIDRLTTRISNIAEKLNKIYVSQIKNIFPEVSASPILRNSKNAPLYSLLLASHAELAVRKMNEIFARFDKLDLPRRKPKR